MYFRKLTVELFGGAITASFISLVLRSKPLYALLGAFLVGIAWAGIIQVLRARITSIVTAAIGKELGR